MSMTISIYSKRAFKEWILPSLDNTDYQILIRKEDFHIAEDLYLKMEVLDGSWRIEPDPAYTVKAPRIPAASDSEPEQSDQSFDGQTLSDGDVLTLQTATHELLSLIIRSEAVNLHPFTRYDLHSVEEITIGKDPNCDIRYDFRIGKELSIISRVHARILRCKDGFQIVSTSANGIYVNAERIRKNDSRILAFGDFVNIFGLHLVYLGRVLAVSAGNKVVAVDFCSLDEYRTKPSVGQKTEFSPSPKGKIIGSHQEARPEHFAGTIELEMPDLPADQMDQAETKKFDMYCHKKELEISQKYESNRRYLQALYPDFSYHYQEDGSRQLEIPELYSISRSTRSGAEEYLSCRIGVGQRRFDVEIQIPRESYQYFQDPRYERLKRIKEAYQVMDNVPVSLKLRENRVLGILGDPGTEHAVDAARMLAISIARGHSAEDVRMVFFMDGYWGNQDGPWSFARWLPHVWDDSHKMRYLASSHQEQSDLTYELTTVYKNRGEKEKTHYVVFVPGTEFLENAAISQFVDSIAGREHITIVVASSSRDQLPRSCSLILLEEEEYWMLGGNRISLDQISAEDAELFARSLAASDQGNSYAQRGLPDLLTFFELWGISRPDELDVGERWAKNRTYEKIGGLIGSSENGVTCSIDLNERRHGPHGLIAGTTGSGKSALLETLILSLAVNYSPRDLNFVMIDFKGGGMANQFRGLPHLIGSISNLSGYEIGRAMAAISSEVKRRQRTLAGLGISHIDDYTRLYKGGTVDSPMPHLLIVIDEFAELKKDTPEFLSELISVAQLGRSIGVHLILATQRPSGCVDENIRSNTRFRFGLRMQSREDSMEVLEHDDAAWLQQVGRGFFQVGRDEIYQEIQVAYAKADYDEEGRGPGVSLLTRTGREDICSREPIRLSERKISQLDTIRDYLIRKAEELAIPRPRGLWLPVLPDQLELENFPTEKERTGDLSRAICARVGLFDDPKNQRQGVFSLFFPEAGNVLVGGGLMSGKSTLMQTIAWSLIRNYDASELRLFLFDYSSGMLEPFAEARQVQGACIGATKGELADQIGRLESILRKRQVEGAGEQSWPAILVLIDPYEGLIRACGQAESKRLLNLMSRGNRYGIFFILTGSGIGMDKIPARVAEQCRTLVSLYQQERFKYIELFHNSRLDVLPRENVRGRGLAAIEGNILEFQTARACGGDNEYDRSQTLKNMCREQEKTAMEGNCAEDAYVLPLGIDRGTGLPCGLRLKERSSLAITYNQDPGDGESLISSLIQALEDQGCSVWTDEGQDGESELNAEGDPVLILKDPAGLCRSEQEELKQTVLRILRSGSRAIWLVQAEECANLEGLPLYEELRRDCRWIHFGGDLLDNPLADQDWIPGDLLIAEGEEGVGVMPEIGEDGSPRILEIRISADRF